MTAQTVPPPATHPVPARATRREWIGLVALAVPSALVSVDLFVLLLALPQLSRDLGATSNEQLWILDSYGFLLSGFLVTMGNLGDRIGRRKLLLIGGTAFGLASILAAFAPTPELLILARALLGVAGATLAPSTLALIGNMFRDEKQRSLAIGVWLVSMISGSATGPLVGGIMLEHFWWGSVFLLAVPAMVVLLIVGPRYLPEYRSEHAGRIDLPSVVLSFVAILPVIYGIKELAKNGAQPLPIASLLAGLALGAAFLQRQRRLEHPLVDLKLFADRSFTTALVSMLANTMLAGAVMVFITQFFQLVLGYSPLESGLWMLPAVAAGIVSFQVSPLLARRIRPARLIPAGLAISTAGLLTITQANSLAPIVIGFVLINLGAGPLVTLGTNLVIGSAPPERAGAAASISQTFNELGFALGVALLGTLGTVVYRANLHGVPAENGVTSVTDPEYVAVARDAFASGVHVVAWVSAAVFVAVAVLIARQLRHVPPIGA
ncbi:MFS transporter [Tenggerimyces flavus]|uniref:MFS transporter n=1 Tax=Tenggerimyces flavus TaxID=1708749 RepID=A0ABV7YCN3_9ACTN|nr:MFS transporter [Tenggerimyces flavus]MBM7783367.1 DHA2 family multidrug resistance protein-like MFS transporter [Tenggerimyces flavus]